MSSHSTFSSPSTSATVRIMRFTDLSSEGKNAFSITALKPDLLLTRYSPSASVISPLGALITCVAIPELLDFSR